MRKIFLNNALEEEITVQGYAVVSRFIPASVIDDLNLFFENSKDVDTRPFTISNWTNQTDYRTRVYEKLENELLPYAANYLEDYIPVMGVFASKRPDAKSDMLLHQDWSLVNEDKFRSVSVWVALGDMNRANGNLQVASRSHLYGGFPRGMNIPVPFEDIRKELQQHFLTDIPLKAGDAVFFDHRLIHASPPNLTSQLRLAAVLALIPTEAELVHYYRPENNFNQLEVLKMDRERFHAIDFFNPPHRPENIGISGLVDVDFRQITINEVKAVCEEEPFSNNTKEVV